MTNKGKRSNKKSLCEQTMKIVANIIKISSLSLAKKSLGNTAGPPRMTYDPLIKIESVSRETGQLRLQEPKNSSKPSSYMLPDEGSGISSSYVIRDGMNVDGKASDYIRRFHEKNRIHSHNVKVSPHAILPPPPPLIK